MKTLVIVLMTLVMVPFVTAQTEQFAEEKKSAIVDNLTVGIKSDNTGIRVGSVNEIYDLIE